MLGQAMREISLEESEPAIEDVSVSPLPQLLATQPPLATDRRFEGLDPRYRVVLAELLTRPDWSRDDFDTLVRRHKLMPSGTIDRINEWAQDRLDDLIIENDGDDLTVNANLIRE